MTPERILLMIPGPSEPEPEVFAALAFPIVPHYGERWKIVYNDTISKLQKVFRTKNEVILLPSPGQTALEMAVANMVRKDEDAFVCSNGLFSEMIVEMVRYYGGNPKLITAEYGKAVTAEDVKSAIQSTKDASGKCLFVVHSETSTGVANPVNNIMRICHEEGVISVLDSISAFGGMDVRVDDWNVDFCIGYPSKGIGGFFGATPVAISKECWDIAKKNKDRIQARFLNLNVWRYYIDEWGDWGHAHPSTMPENIIVALDKALELVLKEGLDERYKRHQMAAKLIRDGLERLGLEIFPDKRWTSDTVSVAKIDPKYDERIRAELLENYNIMIAGGLGKLRGKVIRIGHMGTSASRQATSLTLAALESVLKSYPEMAC
ncbi:MAG: pyridoxal-phosphate-dependent aminotransferase family protein [Nitrososphaerales archaeon]